MKYIIDLDNEGLINAVATHNKNIVITAIYEDGVLTDSDDMEEITGADLINIATEAKNRGTEKLKIKYSPQFSDTLTSIFPIVKPLKKGEWNITPAQEAVVNRFEQLLMTNGSAAFNCLDPLDSLQAITKEDALNVIHYIAEQYDNLGAIHLSDLDAILFVSNDLCYFFEYGEEPFFEIIKNLSLDLESGFDDDCRFMSSHRSDWVVGTLNEFFSKWKEKNYEGLLIPQSLGLNFEQISQAAAKSSQAGMFAQNKDVTAVTTIKESLNCAQKTQY